MCQDLCMPTSQRTWRGATAVQRVEQRRARLVDAAIDLFGTIGYRATSVEHVCARAGLSKRYFYESFPDSEALLMATYQRCADEIHQAMLSAVQEAPETIDAQLRCALTGYFGAIAADPRRARITLLEILGVSPAIDAAYAEQTARFATSVQTLAAAAFESSKLPKTQLHVIAQGVIGAITTIATQWLLEQRRRPGAQLIDATHVLVLAILDRLTDSSR
jgi:AcrR family transcriptional regulator